jgi:serine/threonine protein kinase/tetratricopeptide (TPR) repeat protein
VIGQTISHYKVLEKLGEGGMGVVYKAEDTKLKRTVALKFLSPQALGTEDEKARFMHEAQAAAALNHPNICTVHEIDETEGQPFIAMEHVEGRSLKDLIEAGPLKLEESRALAMQISEGIHEAHRRRVVHRDIKPANIMITDEGRVKIMDFGLAKSPGRTQLTREGTTVGTVAYMSPEQTRGEGVDHRTDIWSLGVILYEMISGQPPFKGDHEQAVIYSIVNEEPKPLTGLRTGVPIELERIVRKAMAKKPEDRYQHADELTVDLRSLTLGIGSDGRSFSASRKTEAKAGKRWRTYLAGAFMLLVIAGVVYVTKLRQPQNEGITTEKVWTDKSAAMVEFDKSIVVLPFEDISPSGDNEYFSDGLTDEIIADLSKVHSLRVISRTSAMALKGTEMDVKSVGKRLDVRYVLEGSVRKAGDKLKITAQLIDAAVDAHVWTEKYDGTLKDIFDIQEKVSRAIVGELKVELRADEDQVIAERPLDDVRAYELYLRAMERTGQMSEAAIDSAIDDLDRALDIVGDNALIYAAMGHAYWQYANIGARTLGEIEGKVEECVQKVFELEPESVQGYMLLSRLELYRGNTNRTVEYLRKVLEHDPYNTDALRWLGFMYAVHAKTDVAWKIFEIVERNDPLEPGLLTMKGYVYFLDGRFDLVLKTVGEDQNLGVPDIPKRMLRTMALIYIDRPEEATREVETLERDVPGSYFARHVRFLLDAYEGKQASVEEIMTPDFAAATQQDFQYSLFVAAAYAALGEKGRALTWLENAIDMGFNNYVYISEHDPFLKTLGEEERFKELMRRAKANCDQFEALE